MIVEKRCEVRVVGGWVVDVWRLDICEEDDLHG